MSTFTTVVPMFLGAIVLLVFYWLGKSSPNNSLFSSNPLMHDLLLVIISIWAGSMGWSFNEYVKSLQDRAQTLILEHLSTVDSCTREEIRRFLIKQGYFFWTLFDVHTIVLHKLISANKIEILSNKYQLVKNLPLKKTKASKKIK